MKNIGIWLDKEKAHIIAITKNGNETITTINSNIENYHIGGGSGSKQKGGPQDVVQDSKYLEREKHQFKSYFKEITTQLTEADAIVIFGPSDIDQKFKKELVDNYKLLDAKVKGVKKADSMTQNQMKALVRDFYDA